MITQEQARRLLKEVPKPPPPDLKKRLRALEVGEALKFKMIVDVKGVLTGLEFGVRRTPTGFAALSRPFIYKGVYKFPWHSVKKEYPLTSIEKWILVGTQTWKLVKERSKTSTKSRFETGDILVGGFYMEGGFLPEFYVVKDVFDDVIELELLSHTTRTTDWSAIPSRRTGKVFTVPNEPTGPLKKTRTGLGVWNKVPVDVGVDSDIKDYWR